VHEGCLPVATETKVAVESLHSDSTEVQSDVHSRLRAHKYVAESQSNYSHTIILTSAIFMSTHDKDHSAFGAAAMLYAA
jgi:hypothetical protein